MALNIEIKAKCPDPQSVISALKNLDVSYHGEDFQTDTFFKVPNGRLKIRQSTLSRKNMLIPYFRSDIAGPKESNYALIELDNPTLTKDLFTKMFGVQCVVQKRRRIYLFKNVRIHLDSVEHLGSFIELEAVIENKEQQKEANILLNYLITELNIRKDDLIDAAYADLLKAV